MPIALISMMIRPGIMIPRHTVNKPERAMMVKSNAIMICVSLGIIAFLLLFVECNINWIEPNTTTFKFFVESIFIDVIMYKLC